MMSYDEYHARCAHALTCPHDAAWIVEPLVTQLNDPETPVMHHDQQYLASLIAHMAEQIDEKDGQLSSGTALLTDGQDLLRVAAERLQDVLRKLLIVTACWIATAGVLVGVLLGR